MRPQRGRCAARSRPACWPSSAPSTLCDGRLGFFAPGQLRFGTVLERSELEAAVQRAVGVEGVVAIDYRRRGYVPTFVPMPEAVTVGRDEIIRVDNDPSQPDRGSIRVVVEGGK